MHCPFCRHPDSRVVDSRDHDEGAATRRRRACQHCGRRVTTVETAALSVVKRSGASEPFSRAKVADGVRKACSGRPVSEDALALLAQQVEEEVRRHFGELVFRTSVPRSVRLAEAPSHGLPAIAYDRRSAGADAYWKVAMELVERA